MSNGSIVTYAMELFFGCACYVARGVYDRSARAKRETRGDAADSTGIHVKGERLPEAVLKFTNG
jgi:hypothetical protein